MKVKANVVANALGRKYSHSLHTMFSRRLLIDEFQNFNIQLVRVGAQLNSLTLQPEVYAEIKEKQASDAFFKKKIGEIRDTEDAYFKIHGDRSLRYKGK